MSQAKKEASGVIPSARLRMRMAGWMAVLIGTLAWVVMVVGFSALWTAEHTEQIDVGTTWVVGELSLTAENVLKGQELLWTTEEPVQPKPGAIFVVVTLTYQLTEPSGGFFCSVTLVGENREWGSTYDHRLDFEDSSRDYLFHCPDPTEQDPLQGVLVHIFEIPTEALGEIQGIRMKVTRRDDEWTILDEDPTVEAVLKLDFPQ